MIFLVIIAAAVATESAELAESKALFTLATTIFGVVVGFLGGEKSST